MVRRVRNSFILEFVPLPLFYFKHHIGSHAKPRLQSLLPNMSGTNIPRTPIPIRLPVRRQTTSMPELRRNNTRTSRILDSVPRLLTSLKAMWIIDLREPLEETRSERKRDNRVKKPSKTHHKGLSRQAR